MVEVSSVDYSDQWVVEVIPHAPLLLVTAPIGTPAEEQLLQAMLRAIGCSLEQCSRIQLLQVDQRHESLFQQQLQQQIADVGPEAVLQLVAFDTPLSNAMVTYSPAHLLAQPVDKRHAWEVLKKVSVQISS